MKILIVLFLIFTVPARATSLLIGLKSGISNTEQSQFAAGFNGALLFGPKGSQLGIGGTKYFYQEENLWRDFELMEVFYKMNNFTFGTFYGFYAPDAESMIENVNLNNAHAQYGIRISYGTLISSSVEMEIEGRYHTWEESTRGDNYLSTWINLNYLWF